MGLLRPFFCNWNIFSWRREDRVILRDLVVKVAMDSKINDKDDHSSDCQLFKHGCF